MPNAEQVTYPWSCPLPGCNHSLESYSLDILKEEMALHRIFHEQQYATQSRQDNPVRGGNGAVRKRGNWDDVKLFTVTQYPKHSIPMSEWKEFVKSAKTNISCYGLGENSSATKSEVKGRVEALQNDLMTEVTDNNVTLDALLEKMKVMMTKELLWERECNKFMLLKMQEGEKCAEFHERIQRQLDLTGLKTCNSCNTLDQLKKVLATQRIFDTALQKEVMSRSGILKSSYLQTATWTDTKDKVRQLEEDYAVADEYQDKLKVAASAKTPYKRQCRICKDQHKTETCRKACKLKKCSDSKPHKYSTEHHKEVDPNWVQRKKKKINAIQAKQVESGTESDEYSSARFTLSSASLKKHRVWDEKSKNTKKRAPWSSPTVEIMFELAADALMKEGKRPPTNIKQITTTAIVDTGANICMMSKDLFNELGYPKAIVETEASCEMADGSHTMVKEGTWMRLTTTSKDGKNKSTTQLVYLVERNTTFYISYEAATELGVIERIWGADGRLAGSQTVAAISNTDDKLLDCRCDGTNRCKIREKPDDHLIADPGCPFTMENVGRIQQHLLNTFSSSTFNQCENQPLPMMNGPPVRITLKKGATPVFQKSGAVPAHLEEKAKENLERDERLGVIKKLDPNTPTEWCARLVWATKPNGDLRRTIDLTGLNKASKRQLHMTTTPFQQASKIPEGTLKTVMDAWNGYHSVPVHEEDRKYLNFGTQFGTYQMCVAPQGWCTSGDAYTRRYDDLIKDVTNVVKQIDDTLLWADSVEDSYRRTVEYLKLVGNYGIIINKKKFVFAETEVDYAGFRITKDKVKPLEKNLNAIRDFPIPTNIAGVRSFYALANNLNFSTKVKEIIGDFRHLLSPRAPFNWDEDMTKKFKEVTASLVEQARDGVAQFDMKRWTVLETDYSKDGLGFCLKQKTCKCAVSDGKINLMCCESGFKPIMCGSRFTSTAEANYAAVEGELLALSWALESTEHFTLQNPKLVISTDHKPLVELVNNSTLTDLNKKNKRLCRLKERILRWNIRDVIYTPGKDNSTADALSRRPTAAACVLAAATSRMRISDDTIATETEKSRSLQALIELMKQGFPEKKQEMRKELAEYWQVRDRLTIKKTPGGTIILMDRRKVIPKSLRDETCKLAHSAHQGVNNMMKTLETRVYWPSMMTSLQQTRNECDWCTRRAPSQAKLPPANIEQPTKPMQSICIDFALVGGRRYGIMVDRFTNWPTVWSCRSMTLCNWLAEHIKTFGMPEIISTDRGAEFMAHDFQSMMKENDIHHRASSAYNPHSNNRAETAVKSMKRLLDEHAVKKDLQNNNFIKAIITYRNTPLERGLPSPNELLFGRNVRDYLPSAEVDGVEEVHNTEKQEWEEKLMKLEQKREIKHDEAAERWAEHSRQLPALENGDSVAIQNGHGNQPKRWDLKGKVVKYNGHDQYEVVVADSRRVTTRNRRHLRKLAKEVTITPPRSIADPNPQPKPDLPRKKQDEAPASEQTKEPQPEAADGGDGVAVTAPQSRRSGRTTAKPDRFSPCDYN